MSPKLYLLTAFADVARALGNPHRLDLLEQLAQGEKAVEGLARKCDLTVANASQHLQVLRGVGLVTGVRHGKQVIYGLAGEDVLELLAALQRVSQRHADCARHVIDDYFHARDALEPVAFEQLRERLADGLVTLIDVRPADEFADGHVPGAVNVPLAELESRWADLPREIEVVAYCRGPWCVLAFEAVALLRDRGLSARRLDGGLPEWRRAGLDVVTGVAS